MINVILFEPEIPNNTGNIIRICLATGAKLHLIKPLNFDLHPKWFKRAAAGRYLTDIEHEIHDSYEHFVKKYGNKKIVYVTRYGQKNHTAMNYQTADVWLMFGKESTGIPKNILRPNFEDCVRIPMKKNTRSLNLANAVAILLYEVHRQNNFINLEQFEDQKGKDWLLVDQDEDVQ